MNSNEQGGDETAQLVDSEIQNDMPGNGKWDLDFAPQPSQEDDPHEDDVYARQLAIGRQI